MTSIAIDTGTLPPVIRSAAGRPATLLRRMLLPALVAGLVLVLWHATVIIAGIPAVIVPPPLDVALALFKHRVVLVENILPTLLVAVGGFLIATAAATLLAAAMTSFSLLRDAVYPCLVAFQLIPKIALAPIFIIWFGLGGEARLAFAVFISFFPILVSTATGLEAIEASLARLCRSMNASRLRVLLHVRIPTAIPFALSGMKVAITMAVIGAIIGEFITSRAGLGFLILTAASRADTELVMATIVVLCVCGMALYGAVEALDRLLARWTSP